MRKIHCVATAIHGRHYTNESLLNTTQAVYAHVYIQTNSQKGIPDSPQEKTHNKEAVKATEGPCSNQRSYTDTI